MTGNTTVRTDARAAAPQLLLDLTELVRHDARSGVQRVTRAWLAALLAAPPAGWRVRPVYDAGGYYAYALADGAPDDAGDSEANGGDDVGDGAPVRTGGGEGQAEGAGTERDDGGDSALTRTGGRHGASDARFVPAQAGREQPVRVAAGDVFLGLDLTPESVPRNQAVLASLKLHGVRLYFIIYDLLPVRHPEWFVDGLAQAFEQWLRSVTTLADGLVAISRATADDLLDWLAEHPPVRADAAQVGWVHLGADLDASAPSRGIDADGHALLARLGGEPTLLMVGTIEPRKMQAQALDALERLWDDGVAINLVIVGKPGWRVEALAARLRDHPQRGSRLFWLEGASDELLDRLYGASSALLAASQAEGFGLPLIEAARHGLPVIARDLPVFREVGGAHAWYFTAADGAALADALRRWLALHADGLAPASSGMPHLDWAASAGQLKQLLSGPAWYAQAPSRLPPG